MLHSVLVFVPRCIRVRSLAAETEFMDLAALFLVTLKPEQNKNSQVLSGP